MWIPLAQKQPLCRARTKNAQISALPSHARNQSSRSRCSTTARNAPRSDQRPSQRDRTGTAGSCRPCSTRSGTNPHLGSGAWCIPGVLVKPARCVRGVKRREISMVRPSLSIGRVGMPANGRKGPDVDHSRQTREMKSLISIEAASSTDSTQVRDGTSFRGHA